jgi:hypothetical protein
MIRKNFGNRFQIGKIQIANFVMDCSRTGCTDFINKSIFRKFRK